MRRFVALFRGINVSGRNQIAMADLRELAAGLGWSAIRSYAQSGNMVFAADADAPELERRVELRLEAFGLKVAAIVRPAERWTCIVESNPFRQVAEAEPNRVLLYLSKLPQQPGAEAVLRHRAQGGGETVATVDDALWIYFPQGIARSKLVPALVDRVLGSQSTGRNWRTVVKIGELLQ